MNTRRSKSRTGQPRISVQHPTPEPEAMDVVESAPPRLGRRRSRSGARLSVSEDEEDVHMAAIPATTALPVSQARSTSLASAHGQVEQPAVA